MQDLTFVLGIEHDPADLWTVLGDAGIEMEGACAFPRLEGRVVHVAVSDEDGDRAYEALRAAGYLPLDRREALLVPIDPRPGELGRLARRVSDAGASIHLLYLATSNRVVVAADDLEAARSALGL